MKPPELEGPFNPLDSRQRNERLHRFAHALKNRMGGVWQAASLLHAMPQGPERDMLLAMAEKNYFNAARELEQLLDDFQVPRGVGTLRRERTSLSPLLDRCIGQVAFRTVKKEQRVDFTAAGNPEVEGDSQLLEQLFGALLSNASKFSPKGTAINVHLGVEDGQAVVAVTDRGAGLTEADLQEVFIRFALLSTRSTDGESQARSTLGRAKQWAEAHGGSLEVRSDGPGQGSVFTVRLPLA
ncbi:MAG: HAMP domain-containing histidine kinase [Flavobacteriales bacterium]|nr:HAMP domain-containing histidine kinase [Flavobacteriales bacterium]MCL4281191.1 HAMP domain-containing histidine kinase [Flavobacteriales bacterium]